MWMSMLPGKGLLHMSPAGQGLRDQLHSVLHVRDTSFVQLIADSYEKSRPQIQCHLVCAV